MNGTKHAIRQSMRRRRDAVSPDEAAAAGRAVLAWTDTAAPYRAAAVVLAYVASDGEVPTAALIERAWAAGKRVYLPRVEGPSMEFAEHRPGAPLVPGRFGIPVPIGEKLALRDEARAIAFVPLVAFDETGTRLGRGGGFYDRSLGDLAGRVCPVGLGYAFQQCPVVPGDPWDVRLEYVVTERGAVHCRSGDNSSPVRKEDTTCNGLPIDDGRQSRRGRGTGLRAGLFPAPAE